MIAGLVYLQLRKESYGSEEFHGQSERTSLSQNEQDVQQTLITHQNADKPYIKTLLIHGTSLIELLTYSGSSQVRQECEELLEKSIKLKSEKSPELSYFRTTNFTVQSTEKFPSLAMRRNIETYLVLRGKELISIELIRDGISEGFLHPLLIIEQNKVLYEHASHGKFQLADELIAITFEEFKEAWAKYNSSNHNTRWSRWLIENHNSLT